MVMFNVRKLNKFFPFFKYDTMKTLGVIDEKLIHYGPVVSSLEGRRIQTCLW